MSAVETSTVSSKDGTPITYDRRGAGPTVVLVDGAFCRRTFGPMPKIAPLLADHFTVLNYDRRGRGDSGDTQPYARERELEDLDAVIAAAGGGPVRLFGISSGAMLSLRAVARGPDAEDGIDDSLVDGKADTGGLTEGTPQACGVLKVANTATYTVLHHDATVAANASNNIFNVRVGDDGAVGTADDTTFHTLHELDAVVGPVAFRKLLAYANANGYVTACTNTMPPPPSCTGLTVPGDYASRQTALYAVANAGQDATICLGEGAFTNARKIVVTDPNNHRKTLHIIGRSRELTRITQPTEIYGGWDDVSIQGVTIDTAAFPSLEVFGQLKRFEISDSKVTTGFEASSSYEGTSLELSIDRCELDTGGGEAFWALGEAQPFTVHVTNSYLHGTLVGDGSQYKLNLDVVNNTIVGGIDLHQSVDATLANNIITCATTYGMAWDSGANITARNNALWAMRRTTVGSRSRARAT